MLLKLFIIHIEQKGSKKTYFLLILLNLIIYLGLSCNSICILDKYIPIIPINSVLRDATNIISVLICNISLLFISIIINIINVINANWKRFDDNNYAECWGFKNEYYCTINAQIFIIVL